MDINERMELDAALADAEDAAWEQYRLAFLDAPHFPDGDE